MSFIDEVILKVASGNGGPGAVTFLREKFRPWGGPDGGDGGKGGSVYVQANTKLSSLTHFRHKRKFYAESGHAGMRKQMSGKKGEDVVIEVPPGTLITDIDTGDLLLEVLDQKEPVLLFEGGQGGQGNMNFASGRNRSPRYAQPGMPGMEAEIKMELKLIANVGLIGLPNAGKSTLLSVLTHAHPKIADYAFTTIHPNLGVLEYDEGSIVIADIPGLVEGASHGKGLGDRFLKHVERTGLLLHVVDISGQAGDPMVNIDVINKELKDYEVDLSGREQWLVFNKMDLPESQVWFEKNKKKFKVPCFAISAAATSGIVELKQKLMERHSSHG
jgi:GTP-binding protein